MKYTNWVHGVSVTPELTTDRLFQPEDFDWTDLRGLPQGFGAEFGVKTGENWFHLAIPTPTLVSNAIVKLSRIMLLWDVRDTVGLPPNEIAVPIGPSSIHAWDAGQSRLFAKDYGLPLKSGPGYAQQANGSQGIIEGLNGWMVPGNPVVNFGLCLSFLISSDFGRGGEVIRIIGGGADFESP